jgi:hypothetical protein
MADTHFSGPQELAETISKLWRSYTQPRRPADISAEGISKLIELAYYAGFQKDEGRYVRMRLFVKASSDVEKPPVIMQFAEPLPLTHTDIIRRLAPTIPFYRHALLVSEPQPGQLHCEGVVDMQARESGGYAGDPLKHGWLSYSGLIVRVDGPGRVRISGGFGTYELRTGQISRISSFLMHPLISSWLTGLSRSLEESCIRQAEQRDPQAAAVAREQVASVKEAAHPAVTIAWSKVLMTADSLQHGGALVVLPDGSASVPHIKLQFRARDIALDERILEFWDACIVTRCARGRNELDDATREWKRVKGKLFSAAEALGHMTAADGCVVLDRQMRLRGFGGRIHVDEAVLQSAPRLFVDYQSKRPLSEDDLARFGTRHSSAFRLCKACPGVMVFVISQDGDLRVFASDAEHVYLIENLSPAVLQPDQS